MWLGSSPILIPGWWVHSYPVQKLPWFVRVTWGRLTAPSLVTRLFLQKLRACGGRMCERERRVWFKAIPKAGMWEQVLECNYTELGGWVLGGVLEGWVKWVVVQAQSRLHRWRSKGAITARGNTNVYARETCALPTRFGKSLCYALL